MLQIRGAAGAFAPSGSPSSSSACRPSSRRVQALDARFVHFVDLARAALGAAQQAVLDAAADLRAAPAPAASARAASRMLVVPRAGTISPWSSKATDIAQVCGLARRAAHRARHRVSTCSAAPAAGARERSRALAAVLFDRMTEMVLLDGGSAARLFEHAQPQPLARVSLASGAARRSRRRTAQLGLALSADEIDYLLESFARLGRDPTDVELMMFAQANSEHCRHKIFNADWIIDGEPRDEVAVRDDPQHARAQPRGRAVGLPRQRRGDRGRRGRALLSRSRDRRSTARSDEPIDILMKVETHNHPTAISPFPGAATGSGGEIRDEGATGRGAKPKAGLVGFSVSHLRIPGYERPWERDVRQAGAHRLGARDHDRGPDRRGGVQQRIRPAGDLRLLPHLRAARRAGDPPQRAARLSQADHDRRRPGQRAPRARARRPKCRVGAKLVVLGGPAMLIGLGGGAASSLGSGAERGSRFRLRAARQPRDPAPRAGSHRSLLGARRATIPSRSSTTSARAGSRTRCPRRSRTVRAARASTCAPCRAPSRACRRWRSGATRRRSATCWRSQPQALRASSPRSRGASAARSPSSARSTRPGSCVVQRSAVRRRAGGHADRGAARQAAAHDARRDAASRRRAARST